MEYAPAPWLPGPHAMTLYGALLRPFPRPRFRRERWELADGDFLDVDRLAGPGEGAPVLVVCHGLEGSSRAPYVRGLAARAQAAGLAVAALNFRSCSGAENRLPRFYHSGETSDLAEAVARLCAERPGRALVLAGFSLGGNVVVKYLGERGDRVPGEVKGAAAISVPFDLAACARALDGPGGWVRLYRGRFLRSLRAKALRKERRFPGLLDRAAIRSARTFAAFDAAVTAPLHGFRSAEDYWARSSSGPFLPGVGRPLLAVSALDDPLVPAGSLPLAAARENPLVSFLATPKGGHVGFLAGTPAAPRFFAEERAAAFLSRLAVGPGGGPP